MQFHAPNPSWIIHASFMIFLQTRRIYQPNAFLQHDKVTNLQSACTAEATPTPFTYPNEPLNRIHLSLTNILIFAFFFLFQRMVEPIVFLSWRKWTMVQRRSPAEARQLRPYLTVSRKREGAKTGARQLQVGPLGQFYFSFFCFL